MRNRTFVLAPNNLKASPEPEPESQKKEKRGTVGWEGLKSLEIH